MPHLSDDYVKDRIRAGGQAQSGAQLNFAFTDHIVRYLEYFTEVEGKLSYSALNAVLGALEGAKQEFVRQIVNPYEETKANENGNVYPAILREVTWSPGGKPLPQKPNLAVKGTDTVLSADAVAKINSSVVHRPEAAYSADERVKSVIVALYDYSTLTASPLRSTIRYLLGKVESALSAAEYADRTSP